MYDNGISAEAVTKALSDVKSTTCKLSADIKHRWLTDLRSPNHKQMSNYLHQAGTNKYCCLGLLCEIRNVPHVGISNGYVIYGYKYLQDENSDVSIMPWGVGEEIALENKVSSALVILNDCGAFPFSAIANLIEEYL